MCACLSAGISSLARNLIWEISTLFRAPSHAVLVGLDSSGKTTTLLRLKYNQYVNAVPTVGFNTEKIRSGKGAWIIWDVGGAEKIRPLWRSYTRATDALIYVVDSSSTEERLEESKVELHRLLKQQSSQCFALHRQKPPVLIIANKQDLPDAREPNILSKALGLLDLPPSQLWTVEPVCAITGEGLEEAMRSLNQMIAKCKKK